MVSLHVSNFVLVTVVLRNFMVSLMEIFFAAFVHEGLKMNITLCGELFLFCK